MNSLCGMYNCHATRTRSGAQLGRLNIY